MFVVYSEADIEKFKNLVNKEGAVWDNSHMIKFLNSQNKPIGCDFEEWLARYACIYHFDRDLYIEVLC